MRAAVLLGALALLHAPAPAAWSVGGGVVFARASWTDEVRYTLANYAYYKVSVCPTMIAPRTETRPRGRPPPTPPPALCNRATPWPRP